MGRYVYASQMAAILGLDSSTAPEVLDFFIASAEAAIDRETGRRFDAITETRQFDIANPGRELVTGDLVSVTAVGVADSTGGDFTTLAVSDYYLGPSVRSYGAPYQWIALSDLGSYSYAYGYRTVEIAGTWGWAAVPADIASVAMSMAVRTYQQSRGGGVSRITDIPGLGTVEFTSATEPGSVGGFSASESRALARYRRMVFA